MGGVSLQRHVLAFAAVLFLSLTAFADEGMWVYNNLPVEQVKTKYGFTITPGWADHLRLSSVRMMSGGSGSFVSADGLILTNHHVAASALQHLSKPGGPNYYEVGFTAKTPGEEIPVPDFEINQLVAIKDVTDRVNAAVTPGMSAAEANDARKKAIAQIEKEATDADKLRSDVVPLYQGGQYHLYQYKKYTDIRLVFAPEFAAAFFGGDADNFEFPRFNLDMTLFRAYENGKPVKTDNFLKWSPAGAKDDELVFVSGHPGKTSRLFTAATFKYLRDTEVPFQLNLLRRREITYQLYSAKSPEHARRAKEELFGIQNRRKVFLGRLKSLQGTELIPAKEREERETLAAVAADLELKPLASAWTEIAGAQVQAKQLLLRRTLMEGRAAFNTSLFGMARVLVRMAEEDKKPNDQRLPEYRDSARESLLESLFSPSPIYSDFEEAKLADSLSMLVEKLGTDHAWVKLVLKDEAPHVRAAQLVRNTKLSDVAARKKLAAGGLDAILASDDPMIRLAREVDADSRKLRKEYEAKVEGVERAAYAKVARVQFKLKGTSTYPDATFTLRLAYGQVKGYDDVDGAIPAMTTIGGAFEYEASKGGKDPYQLPASWHRAKGALNLTTPFNFVSTNDIIGGNSGSPVVNTAGELVGLIFDGNAHSLDSDYRYTDTQSRAVSVHSAAMLELMKKVYGADHIVRELVSGNLVITAAPVTPGPQCPKQMAIEAAATKK